MSNIPLPTGHYVCGGIAINRSAGYVYSFCDEGQRHREIERFLAGLTFLVDWTSAPVTPRVGANPTSGEAMTIDIAAVALRDNVSFIDIDDARAQAAAMLHEMRSYVP